MTLRDESSPQADAELEVLARLTSSIQRPAFWRNGQMIFYGGRECDDLEKQALTASLMAQIYAAPLESQQALATQLMREHSDVARDMWIEAAYTCHAGILKAFDDSGQMATRRKDTTSFLDDALSSHEKSQRQRIFDASKADKTDVLQKVLDEALPDQASQIVFDSCVNGDFPVLMDLLERDVELHPESRPWITPLHAACFNDNLACAQALINHGVDINRLDEFGGTPLMRAAVGGRDDALNWLLENGADPTLRETREGKYNALEYGAGQLSVENIRKLLDRGCEVTTNALGAAASFGNEEAFDLLFERGGYTQFQEASGKRQTTRDPIGNEAERKDLLQTLKRSGSSGSTHIIDSLLNYIVSQGLDQNHSSPEPLSDFSTALQDAALNAILTDNSMIADHLLTYVRSTLQMDLPEHVLAILLTAAAESASPASVKLLIDKYNASVNSLSSPGATAPLFHAVRAGDVPMIRLLVEKYGADIHQAAGKFANGPTALWLAIDQQREDVARELLRLGGPVEHRDPAVTSDSKRVYLSIEKKYRAPVRLLAELDRAWDVEGCDERFLCLEFPDGFQVDVQTRKPDDELKDARDLRLPG